MAASSRDLERALGDLLPLNLGEVRPALRRLGIGKLGRGTEARALEMREKCKKVRRGDDIDLSRPACFASLRRRADQALVDGRGVDRREKYARRPSDPPVEAELPDCDIMRKCLRVGRADCRKQPKRDRQVVMRALLREVGR